MAHGQAFSGINEPNFDARFLTLADLKLRVGETFTYSYRLHNPWHLDLHLLARRQMAEGEVLPVLLDGQRAAPDEHLTDIWASVSR